MRSPYVAYFAGISTVVAALAVGFGGGLLLTDTSAVKSVSAVPTSTQARARITNPNTVNHDVMQARAGTMVPRVVANIAPSAQAEQNSSASASAEIGFGKGPDNATDLLAASAKVPVKSSGADMNRSEPAATQIQTRDAAADQALSAKKLAAEKKQAERRKYAREHEAVERARLARDNADDDVRAEPLEPKTIIRRYEARSDRYDDDDDE